MANQPAVTTLIPHSRDHPAIALDQIPGYPGYLVCRLGIVFSLNSWTKRLRGNPTPLQGVYSEGYIRINLKDQSGKLVMRTIHQLVLLTYIGPRPKGMVSRHINSISTDNRLSNLTYGTNSENLMDRVAVGTANRGERHGLAKLTTPDIPKIREMIANGASLSQAGRIYNVSHATIKRIITGETWSHKI